MHTLNKHMDADAYHLQLDVHVHLEQYTSLSICGVRGMVAYCYPLSCTAPTVSRWVDSARPDTNLSTLFRWGPLLSLCLFSVSSAWAFTPLDFVNIQFLTSVLMKGAACPLSLHLCFSLNPSPCIPSNLLAVRQHLWLPL